MKRSPFHSGPLGSQHVVLSPEGRLVRGPLGVKP